VSLPLVIGLGVLGGIGAITRFLLDGRVSEHSGREFPYGTLAVNLTGAFILGLLAGASLGKNAYTLAGSGLIGAFTTFSTWMFESHRLGEDNRSLLGLANILGSLILGVGMAWAGRQLGMAL
jgi:CrcB protein